MAFLGFGPKKACANRWRARQQANKRQSHSVPRVIPQRSSLGMYNLCRSVLFLGERAGRRQPLVAQAFCIRSESGPFWTFSG